MSNLTVQSINSELVVDSRLIAQELGITHKAFKETIRKYENKLESRGGKPPFETAPGDVRYAETFYYLNERQATFLMTLSINTPEVVEAKDKLETAFYNAKQALTQAAPKLPSNYKEALLALVAAEEEKEKLAEEIQVLTPLAETTLRISSAKNNLSLSDAAKSLGLGRNKMMATLRGLQILMHNNLPPQKYINQGYFDVVVTERYGNLFSCTVVTPKGLTWLAKQV
jgi:phage antirepressor YoqD-like protein